jgi:hypothetical protein
VRRNYVSVFVRIFERDEGSDLSGVLLDENAWVSIELLGCEIIEALEYDGAVHLGVLPVRGFDDVDPERDS